MRPRTLGYILLLAGVFFLLGRWGRIAETLSRDDLTASSALKGIFTSGAADASKRVTIWSNSGSPDVENRMARDFETMWKDKHDEDVKIELHFVQSGRTRDTIHVSFLSGSPPDLMNVTLGTMRNLVVAGMLRPMDDLLIDQLITDLGDRLSPEEAARIRNSDDAIDQLLAMDPPFIENRLGGEAALAYFQANPNDPMLARDKAGRFLHPLEAARLLHMHGRFIGFTGGHTNNTLTYNKKVFRNAARMFPEAGLVDEQGEPVPPRTWNELLEKAKVIREYGKRSGDDTYGIVVQGRTATDIMRGLEPLAATAGTRGFNFAGKPWIEGYDGKAGFFEYDAPGFLAAFRLLMLLKAHDVILPGTSSRQFEDSRVALAEGRAGMLIDGWHSAMIAVERVPWSRNDIGTATIPVPYQINEDGQPVAEQKQAIEELLRTEIPRTGIAWRADASGTTCLTAGAEYPKLAWQWLHYGFDDPERQRISTRRGGLPGSLDLVDKLDDPEWFPYPFQKQAWQVYNDYGLWPQPPPARPIRGLSNHQDVLHGAFFKGQFQPNETQKLDELVDEVRSQLEAYTDAINADLADRVVEEQTAVPAQWTFGDAWDPRNPNVGNDLQRLAARNPQLATQIDALRAELPAAYQFTTRDQVINFFEGFETSASPLNVLWGPGLLLGAVAVYVLMLMTRKTRTGEPALAAARRDAGASWYAYVFVLPAMLMLFAFVIYPSVYQIYLSVHMGDGIAPLRFVGFDQYVNIFSDTTFWTKVLPNTGLYMLVVTCFQIALGLAIASLLNLPMRLNHYLRPLFFIPLAVSLAAVSIVFLGLLGGEQSTINAMLQNMGLGRMAYWLGFAIDPYTPHDWLGDPQTDLYSVMLVGIWHGLPYNIILLLAGLQSIDPQLYEAAKVDGAGPLKRFRHVTIPELLPILIVISFNALIGAARAFGPVWILTEGGTSHSSEVVATYIYKWGFTSPPEQEPDIGYASALGIMYSLILGSLIFANVYIIAQRWKRRLSHPHGETAPAPAPVKAGVT